MRTDSITRTTLLIVGGQSPEDVKERLAVLRESGLRLPEREYRAFVERGEVLSSPAGERLYYMIAK